LIVQISEDLELDFDALRPNEIIIVSDLKFLVQRVIEWYEKKGDNLCLPTFSPTVSKNIIPIGDRLPECSTDRCNSKNT
jgi:hypothetical protein